MPLPRNSNLFRLFLGAALAISSGVANEKSNTSSGIESGTDFFEEINCKEGNTMTYVLIFSWIALIYFSYKGAVMALDKAGML